jgi:hypothetical protein
MRMNKRGDLVSKQLVTVIILVVSLVVLLLLFMLYNWNPIIDKEACHTSIVLRSSFNLGPIKSSDIVPLKCRTEKICMSMEGGDCGFGEPSRDNPVTRIRLSKDPQKANEKVKEIISDALFDCHSMVGKGQLHFMPNRFYEKNYCLVCARLALDNAAKEQIEDISYVELHGYMKERKILSGSDYLKETYDVDKIEDMIQILEVVRQVINRGTNQQVAAIKDLNIDMQKENAIIVQMMTSKTWDTWVAGIGSGLVGGVLTVGGIIAAPISLGTSLSISAVGVAVIAGGVTGAILQVKNFPDGSKYFYPAIYPYDLKHLEAIECSSFETAP